MQKKSVQLIQEKQKAALDHFSALLLEIKAKGLTGCVPIRLQAHQGQVTSFQIVRESVESHRL